MTKRKEWSHSRALGITRGQTAACHYTATTGVGTGPTVMDLGRPTLPHLRPCNEGDRKRCYIFRSGAVTQQQVPPSPSRAQPALCSQYTGRLHPHHRQCFQVCEWLFTVKPPVTSTVSANSSQLCKVRTFTYFIARISKPASCQALTHEDH